MQTIKISAEDANVKFLSAKEFYRESLASQRRIINEYILEAIENGKIEIKLPFEVYASIDEEMQDLEWEYDTWSPDNDSGEEYTMYYIDASCTEDDFEGDNKQITSEDSENGKVKLISAKEFYKKALERQRQIIRTQILEAQTTGRNEVRLRFSTFCSIDEEMKSLEWECGTWTTDDDPDEEYSMFYVDTDDSNEEDDEY